MIHIDECLYEDNNNCEGSCYNSLEIQVGNPVCLQGGARGPATTPLKYRSVILSVCRGGGQEEDAENSLKSKCLT